MAVDFGTASGPIVPGKPYSLPVTARFLYGAPAAGLTGQGQMRLVIDPAPFPALAGYRIGLIRRDLRAGLPGPDAAGHRRAGTIDPGDRHSARARHDASR